MENFVRTVAVTQDYRSFTSQRGYVIVNASFDGKTGSLALRIPQSHVCFTELDIQQAQRVTITSLSVRDAQSTLSDPVLMTVENVPSSFALPLGEQGHALIPPLVKHWTLDGCFLNRIPKKLLLSYGQYNEETIRQTWLDDRPYQHESGLLLSLVHAFTPFELLCMTDVDFSDPGKSPVEGYHVYYKATVDRAVAELSDYMSAPLVNLTNWGIQLKIMHLQPDDEVPKYPEGTLSFVLHFEFVTIPGPLVQEEDDPEYALQFVRIDDEEMALRHRKD